MKQIRATARVDPDEAPAFFNLLAHSDIVEQARVLEVNTSVDGVETFLFAIDGDHSAFSEQAIETPGVESVEVSPVASDRAHALLVMRPLETPLFAAIHQAGPQAGFVFRTPFVYRDGAMHGHAVGDPEPLQDALESTPDPIDVEIEEINQFRGYLDDPAMRLSDRQREVLSVALAMGYYDQPRAATQEDVAAELDCAPQTASDHLRRAEAKVVRAVLDEFGPDL